MDNKLIGASLEQPITSTDITERLLPVVKYFEHMFSKENGELLNSSLETPNSFGELAVPLTDVSFYTKQIATMLDDSLPIFEAHALGGIIATLMASRVSVQKDTNG